MSNQILNEDLMEKNVSKTSLSLHQNIDASGNEMDDETFLNGTVRILSSGSAQDLERLTQLLRAIKY